MVIARDTLRQDLFLEVYNDLNTNITDPLARGKQWIFSRMPDTRAESFPGFPVIIVHIETTKENPTLDNDYSDVDAEVRVWIYSRVSKQTRTLPDQVDARFKMSNFPQFSFDTFDEDANSITVNDQSIHWRRMSYFIGVDYL